ncbi:hypothetical protein PG995_014355 [Apiospora arundinis]
MTIAMRHSHHQHLGWGATTTGGNNSVGPLPIVQPWTVPQDGGCPSINGTLFTPKRVANSTATENITLQGQVAAQTFVQLCETDFPEGDTNPGLHDLYTLYVTTFEECMTTCAEYNRQFQQLQIKTRGRNNTGEDWYCLAASIVKEVGGRCYLKSKNDRSFKNETWRLTPNQFTSGLLIEGI